MKRNYVEDVIRHSGRFTHPRIILTSADFERIRSSDDFIYGAARRAVIEAADGFLAKPTLEYDIPDGIRLLNVSRGVLARAMNLGAAYQLTGDKKYAERLYRELACAAAFKDWNPYHFLDVGEMCFAFSLGYDWIYDYMSEDERRVVRDAIIEKGFGSVMDDYLDRERKRSYRWYQDEPGDNWKFVCNGGITTAALAICDEDGIDRAALCEMLDYAFENTYRAVRDMYLPDGSYSEGFTYWTYASEYLSYYVSALKSAAGTDYGLADYEPVRTSAYYTRLMCANTCRSFNFGDAWEDFIRPSVLLFIGKNYGDRAISTMRSDEIMREPSIAGARDLFWYTPGERVGLGGHPAGFGSVGGDNASFRAGFERDDLYAAIHFGDNDAYHGHLDMGAFVIEWRGKRFICDLGPDNYNVKGGYRNAYRYRAEGHNTIVINPTADLDQERFSVCRVGAFSDGTDGEAYAASDISAAYPGKSLRRAMSMSKDRRWVVVSDEIRTDEGDEGYWFAHTRADVSLISDTEAVLELDGDKTYVRVISGGSISVMPARAMREENNLPDAYDNSEFKKLTLRFTGSADIAVAFAPMPNGQIPTDEPRVLTPGELLG